MKHQIELLIDRLAKTVPCDCPDDIICDCFFHGGLKVYLGDVLAEMDRAEKVHSLRDIGKLIDLWRQCGTKSYSGLQFDLQKILNRAEWEEEEILRMTFGSGHEEALIGLVPKQKEIRSLFEYLLTLKI